MSVCLLCLILVRRTAGKRPTDPFRKIEAVKTHLHHASVAAVCVCVCVCKCLSQVSPP